MKLFKLKINFYKKCKCIASTFFLCLYFFPYTSLIADTEDTTKNNIDIVYHISTLNNWKSIVEEQLDTLQQSGLAEAADSITVTVVGERIVKVYHLFEIRPFYNKVKIIYAGPDLYQYEFPGIHEVQEIAQKKPNTHIFYLHSKGVLHYKTPLQEPIRFWRRYMQYFTIEKWKNCIEALKEADICGVEWTTADFAFPPFFAGNFWWSRASYINTCTLLHNERHDCERFIGTGKNPVVKSFHQSGQTPELLKKFNIHDTPYMYHTITSGEIRGDILNLYGFRYLDKYYRE